MFANNVLNPIYIFFFVFFFVGYRLRFVAFFLPALSLRPYAHTCVYCRFSRAFSSHGPTLWVSTFVVIFSSIFFLAFTLTLLHLILYFVEFWIGTLIIILLFCFLFHLPFSLLPHSSQQKQGSVVLNRLCICESRVIPSHHMLLI